jgi:hypothetical protein
MKSILNDVFCDNGEFSHYQIIDSDTGVILWSEAEDEQKIVEQNKTAADEKKRVALLQKVVERLNVALCCTECCDALDTKYRDLILETKLEK